MIIAYIDPGSGALVWQLAVAGVMGFLFFLSKIRNSIFNRIKCLFKGKPSEENAEKSWNKE